MDSLDGEKLWKAIEPFVEADRRNELSREQSCDLNEFLTELGLKMNKEEK